MKSDSKSHANSNVYTDTDDVDSASQSEILLRDGGIKKTTSVVIIGDNPINDDEVGKRNQIVDRSWTSQ